MFWTEWIKEYLLSCLRRDCRSAWDPEDDRGTPLFLGTFECVAVHSGFFFFSSWFWELNSESCTCWKQCTSLHHTLALNKFGTMLILNELVEFEFFIHFCFFYYWCMRSEWSLTSVSNMDRISSIALLVIHHCLRNQIFSMYSITEMILIWKVLHILDQNQVPPKLNRNP